MHRRTQNQSGSGARKVVWLWVLIVPPRQLMLLRWMRLLVQKIKAVWNPTNQGVRITQFDKPLSEIPSVIPVTRREECDLLHGHSCGHVLTAPEQRNFPWRPNSK